MTKIKLRAGMLLYDYRFLRMWIAVILLFNVTSIVTAVLYDNIRDSLFSQELLNKFEDIAGGSFNPFLMSLQIFVNNIFVTLVSALLSITLILPLFIIAINGAAVGFISSYALYGVENTIFSTPYLIFYSLITHGSIEVPALSIIATTALLAGRNLNTIIRSVASVLPIPVVMLLIAAIIESTLTIALILILSFIKLLI